MKSVGYIVVCHGHGPMLAADGVLYFGNHATLFPTLDAARKAIKATIRERLENVDRDFETEFGTLAPKRVRPAE